jgi:hypothetical protein
MIVSRRPLRAITPPSRGFSTNTFSGVVTATRMWHGSCPRATSRWNVNSKAWLYRMGHPTAEHFWTHVCTRQLLQKRYRPDPTRELSTHGLILAPSGAGAIHPIVWEQFLFQPPYDVPDPGEASHRLSTPLDRRV